MTLWIAYARTGKEFDAQEEAEALGLETYLPRRVDMIRRGTDRRAKPVISPYLPNYMFVRMDADGWHWLKCSKHVCDIMGIIPQQERAVMAFIAKVDADYTARMAQIEAGERVDEYRDGDVLEIIKGPLAGQFARFRRIVEGKGIFPEIEAEAELFGQSVRVTVDPIAARRATA